MIEPGRPPKGYSDIENIFYQLETELRELKSILSSNILAVNEKFEKINEDLTQKEQEYQKKVEELIIHYIDIGEDKQTATSIAESEAQEKLGMHPNEFYFQAENLDNIKTNTIDQLIKSTLISFCSIIEHNLTTMMETNFHPKTFHYIWECIKQLKKERIKYKEESYLEFKKYQNLRNCIIHNNSKIQGCKYEMDVKSILKETSGYHWENSRVIFTDIFIANRFYDVSETFIISLKSYLFEHPKFTWR